MVLELHGFNYVDSNYYCREEQATAKTTWSSHRWKTSLLPKFCSHKVIQCADIRTEGSMSWTLSEAPTILTLGLEYRLSLSTDSGQHDPSSGFRTHS